MRKLQEVKLKENEMFNEDGIHPFITLSIFLGYGLVVTLCVLFF
jgi:hypothetical protein